MTRKAKTISSLGLIILCFLFYGNTLFNDYAIDDDYVIVGNKKVEKGIKAIPEIFISPYIENSSQSFGYRPVTLAVFAIEYQFFGANPFVSHLINVLLYTITCLVLFYLLLLLFKEHHWALALLTTLLFLIHPIHAEVVNNVKSRDELLCFLFALLALRMAFMFAQKKEILYLIAMFLLMALSLLSKLSSITFIAMIPLALYFFGDIKPKRLLAILGILVVAFATYKFSNLQLQDITPKLRETQFIENPLYVIESNFFSRIPMAFYTVGYYLKLLVLPITLVFYYGYNHVPMVDWSSASTWISVAIILPLLVYTIIKFKTKSVLVFGLAYFFVTISMFSNLVKPAVGIIAERFVYIPSLGFCIVVAYLLLKVFKTTIDNNKRKLILHPVLLGIIGCLLLGSAFRVITRNQDWKSKKHLVAHDLKNIPNSVRANNILADFLFTQINSAPTEERRNQLIDSSLLIYKKVVSIYPQQASAYGNLGVLNMRKQDFESAITNLETAIKNGQKNEANYFNLSFCYENTGDMINAIRNLEKAIEENPTLFERYDRVIRLNAKIKKYDTAIEASLKTLEKFPEKSTEIIPLGQGIAEAKYGKGTLQYIDLLLQKKYISTSQYNGIKNQLILLQRD